MHKLKRLFLSRKTVLTLIFLILASVVTGYIFPQRFSSSPEMIEKWQYANPFRAHWVDKFGLDHVYSTPWFSVLLFLFLISLTVSTYEQIKISTRKTFGAGISSEGKAIKVNASEEELAASIKKKGYSQIFKDDEIRRFVKHPWGYWGNVLFHLGIVITIASSLLIFLTQKRGALNLVEGEVYMPGTSWYHENNGIFAGEFVLPDAVRLDKVVADYWETDQLKQLSTELSFIDIQGRPQKRLLAINNVVSYKGLRVYQSQNYGHAFFVELTDKEGRKNSLILRMQNPDRRDSPSYENFQFEGVPYLLKAKYFVDAEKKSMSSSNPLLVMRLVKNNKIMGEIPLKAGEAGKLGPYSVYLESVLRWSEVIFVDINGMPGIFFGFFIIILGGSLTYFMPPREVYIKKEDGVVYLVWKATRFENFYKDEFERMTEAFGEKKG